MNKIKFLLTAFCIASFTSFAFQPAEAANPVPKPDAGQSIVPENGLPDNGFSWSSAVDPKMLVPAYAGIDPGMLVKGNPDIDPGMLLKPPVTKK